MIVFMAVLFSIWEDSFFLLDDDRLIGKWSLLIGKYMHGFNVIGQYCIDCVVVGTNVKPISLI